MVEYWYWLILAGFLLVVEMLTMTTFFLFFAVGSALMGVITLLVPNMHTNLELALTGLFAILAMIAGYYTFKSKRNSHTDIDNINNRMIKQIGKHVVLTRDSENGVSKAKIGDTQWRVLIDSSSKLGVKFDCTPGYNHYHNVGEEDPPCLRGHAKTAGQIV